MGRAFAQGTDVSRRTKAEEAAMRSGEDEVAKREKEQLCLLKGPLLLQRQFCVGNLRQEQGELREGIDREGDTTKSE